MRKEKQVSFPKNKIKILLLENIHSDAVALFNREGFVVETLPKSLSEGELCEKIKDVSILGIRSKTVIVFNTPEGSAPVIKKLAENGYIVGAGYGEFEAKHIRIGNFPMHKISDVKKMIRLV